MLSFSYTCRILRTILIACTRYYTPSEGGSCLPCEGNTQFTISQIVIVTVLGFLGFILFITVLVSFGNSGNSGYLSYFKGFLAMDVNPDDKDDEIILLDNETPPSSSAVPTRKAQLLCRQQNCPISKTLSLEETEIYKNNNQQQQLG